MQLEVGAVVEGRVTSITKFGAFVELPENRTGMVHISEVSTGFVKEISDYLKENQQVRVKIIDIDAQGRINLSIKRLLEAPAPQEARSARSARKPARRPMGWQPKAASVPATFEEMMNKFKQDSDDKMSSLRRSNDAKRGNGKRR